MITVRLLIAIAIAAGPSRASCPRRTEARDEPALAGTVGADRVGLQPLRPAAASQLPASAERAPGSLPAHARARGLLRRRGRGRQIAGAADGRAAVQRRPRLRRLAPAPEPE